MLRNLTTFVIGLGVVLLIGGCSPEAQPKATDKPDSTPNKETEVKTPETQQVAAVYELKIEGMTWINCQARVTELLQSIDGVAEVKVDHNADNASVTMKPGIKFDEKKAHALIDKDYKLVECVEVAH